MHRIALHVVRWLRGGGGNPPGLAFAGTAIWKISKHFIPSVRGQTYFASCPPPCVKLGLNRVPIRNGSLASLNVTLVMLAT